MLRTATVTDVTDAGVWVRSGWLAVPTGPITLLGAAQPGDMVVVSRTDDGEMIAVAGGVGQPGPAGPPGPAGEAPVYVHVQAVASDTWTIAHDLGYHPAVTVVDSSGSVVVGGLDYPDADTVIAHFSAPFGGKAYCS